MAVKAPRTTVNMLHWLLIGQLLVLSFTATQSYEQSRELTPEDEMMFDDPNLKTPMDHARARGHEQFKTPDDKRMFKEKQFQGDKGGMGGIGDFHVYQTPEIIPIPRRFDEFQEEASLDNPNPERLVLTIDGTEQTIDQGIELAKKRRGNTELNIGAGTHTIDSELHVGIRRGWKGLLINFHDVSLIGQGVQKTTLVGGIKSFEAKNLIISDMTITAPVNGSALWLEGESVRVERSAIMGSLMDGVTVQEGQLTMIDVEIFNNQRRGVFVCGYETTLIGKNLRIHHNVFHGIDVVSGAIVELYGKETKVHDNGVNGVVIEFMSDVTVYLDETNAANSVFVNNKGQETSVEEGSSLHWVGYQEL